MTNPMICKSCGGACCKDAPGIYDPTQFEPDMYNNLKAGLLGGLITIDWWEGDPRQSNGSFLQVFFVRPAAKGYEGDVRHPLWTGECTFLTEYGCILEHDSRPIVCQALIPSEDGKCTCDTRFNKRNMSIAWIPYQLIIKKLLDELD